MSSAATSEVEPRGVYWARHRKRGCPLLYAVDSRGDVVKHLVLKDDTYADSAIEYLWHILDRIDAPRRLELVRSTDRDPRDELSPAEDERLYRRFLVRSGASKLRRPN